MRGVREAGKSTANAEGRSTQHSERENVRRAQYEIQRAANDARQAFRYEIFTGNIQPQRRARRAGNAIGAEIAVVGKPPGFMQRAVLHQYGSLAEEPHLFARIDIDIALYRDGQLKRVRR